MNSLQQRSSALELRALQDGFTLTYQQRLILRHSAENPCLWIGAGVADIDMFRGNFSIKDKLNEKIALTHATVSESPDGWRVHFSRGTNINATLQISIDEQGRLRPSCKTMISTIIVSGCAWPLTRMIISTAVANSSLTLICVVNRSRCGPANRAWAATRTVTSPGRRTAKRMLAATITGPSSRSQHLSARRNTTATWITAVI